MLDPVNYGIWLAVIATEIFSLFCMIRGRAFTQHFTLFLYLSACLAGEVGAHAILQSSGYNSDAYYYFFFYSKSVLTICLYFVLMNLYSHVFSDMGAGKYIRGGAAMILAGTAGISYSLVATSAKKRVTPFC